MGARGLYPHSKKKQIVQQATGGTTPEERLVYIANGKMLKNIKKKYTPDVGVYFFVFSCSCRWAVASIRLLGSGRAPELVAYRIYHLAVLQPDHLQEW